MTISELIKKYNITLEGTESLRIRIRPSASDLTQIKEMKAEIINELTSAKEKEENDRKEAKEKLIANVLGLDKLRQIINEWEIYSSKHAKYIENDLLGKAPVKPSTGIKEITCKYPIAAAYLKAESYEYASNYAKSSAGKKAKERIANGEDSIMVLSDMEAEWEENVKSNMWN